MYESKFPSDLEDGYPCEEIIISREVLYPKAFPRKNGRREKCFQSRIEDTTPYCVCSDTREEIQRAKLREMDFKPSSTLKDTEDRRMRKSTKTKRISVKRDGTYGVEDKYNDPDCSIIYSNPFDEDDQMADEFQPHLGCCTSKTTENEDWIRNDISVCTFPVTEKHKEGSSSGSIERTFDFRDDKLTELLPNIPWIPEYSLPETVEMKPEPEVLAAALLMSENEDLGSARPVGIFYKLFSDSSQKRTSPTSSMALENTTDGEAVSLPIGISTVTDGENTNEKIKENAIGETSVSASRDSQINEPVRQEGWNPVDTTRHSSPSTMLSGNTREEWMEDDGMLEYVMKAEAVATPAYRNYVRLNGSVKPSWFTGYALVSPLLPNCIRITSDPGEALLKAWRLCRPRHFDEFSKSFLNTT